MKEGWEIKKLGEVGLCITGSTPSTKNKDFYSSNDYCFVKPSDIAKEGITFISSTEFYVSKSAYRQSRQIPKGTVLVTCIGIIGKVGITTNDCTCNQQINAIIPNNAISSTFLAYSVLSRRKVLEHKANAPVVPILNKKNFSSLTIPVPPIGEQERIVGELDLLSGVIEKKKEQLKELDNLEKAIFFDMFGDPITNEKGWETKKLGYICLLKAGKSVKSNDIHNEIGINLYPCYGGNNIRGYVNKYSHKGTFPIIGRQGALCGNVVLAQGTFYATEHAVVVIPLLEDIHVLWMYYELKCLDLNRYAYGVAQPGLSVNKINEIDVPLPHLSLQQSFAAKVSAIEEQKAKIKASLIEAETLFQSRMSYYFD